MKLREIWENFVTFMIGAPPVNYLEDDQIEFIREKMEAETAFDIGGIDTMRIGGLRDVGLIIPQDTPADIITAAQDVFIAAAKEKGIEIKREDIIHYVPGTVATGPTLRIYSPETWQP